MRTGGGETWVDDSLKDWPDNDFRLFVGDLAKEVSYLLPLFRCARPYFLFFSLFSLLGLHGTFDTSFLTLQVVRTSQSES